MAASVVTSATLTFADLNDAIIGGPKPTDPTEGLRWLDESVSPPKLMKWTAATGWVVQQMDLKYLDPDADGKIEDHETTFQNIGDDNKLTIQDRIFLKDKITEIVGLVQADTSTALPTLASLDSGLVGQVYSLRKQALNVGLTSSHTNYALLGTEYTNLKTYLDSLSPKPWDVGATNKKLATTIVSSTFRDKWLKYYSAADKLAEVIAAKNKQNSVDAENAAKELAKAMTTGKIIHRDPTFKSGTNGVNQYNNGTAGLVTATRIAKPADAPTNSSHVMEIKTTGAASPGWGGFVQNVTSRANAKFVFKVIAKIPVGYTLNTASNSMGTGYTDKILTSAAGTGKYEEYIRVVTCGTTGTFSGGGHFYLSGGTTPTPTAPLIWHVAFSAAYDVTDYDSTVDDNDKQIRADLGLTAPLPTSLKMDGNGITAYTSDPNKFARMDYRGFYAKRGAFQIDGGIDEANLATEVVDKWNNKIDKLFSMNQYLDKLAGVIPTGLPVGGIFTGGFIPNQTTAGGKYNRGEINVDGGVFVHPDTGTQYQVGDDWEIQTQFESNYTLGYPNNEAFIFFVGSDKTRFAAHANTDKKQSYDFMIGYKSGSSWYYDTNNGFATFTPTQNDAIVARVQGSSNGIDKILPYTVSRNGVYVDENGMYAGVIKFDQLFGGEAVLGGADNVNGRLVVIDAAGDVVADLNAATGGFSDLYVGNLTSPTVVALNTTSQTITVDQDNIADIINNLPRWNNATITLNFAGNISSDLSIVDFAGRGSIIIDMKTYKLNGSVIIAGCAGMYVNLKNGTVNTLDTDAIDIDRCSYVRFDDLNVYGAAGTSRAIYAHAGSHVHCDNVKGWNVDAVIGSATGAVTSAINCGGKGRQYGLHAYSGGLIIGDGNIPTGTDANVMQASGVVLGSYTQPTPPTAPTPPPPAEKTTRWTSNACANWGTMYDSWENGVVKQGNYGYGRRSGYWFFPNTIKTTLAGKTIVSARAYIKRKSSGGASAKTPFYLKYHAYQDKPSGAPSPLSMSGSEEKRVDLAWGQSAWVSLPSSFYNNFANGTALGLGVYASSDSKSYYGILDATCYLEVTYR